MPIVRENKKSSEPISIDRVRESKGWRRWLGELNTYEVYFVYAFLLSIVVGFLFGFVNQTLYYVANLYLPRPTSAFEIFIDNFQVDLLTTVTGGLLILLSSFLTFSAISGAIVAHHTAFLRAVFVIGVAFGSYGILEMAGHLCFGLVGFTFLERILLKKRTRLRRLSIFLLGTALMATAAAIEWWDILHIHRIL